MDIRKIIEDAVRDEERLPQDFHVGRVHAFRFVLDLLDEETFRPFYTVDVPHRTVELKRTDDPRTLVDRSGDVFERGMVKPL